MLDGPFPYTIAINLACHINAHYPQVRATAVPSETIPAQSVVRLHFADGRQARSFDRRSALFAALADL